ncbi:hypothetical protein JKP88DRAFT_264935 [Tribonema minus]|uniref:Protein phosphatase inhibitor 2 n=1 Tax=Tribonema minus TaxID=303371 RepID=A0A835YLV4_9STRA|nr:hypothetical protein JKP88DRAFT_264935 [Tribonema minus]
MSQEKPAGEQVRIALVTPGTRAEAASSNGDVANTDQNTDQRIRWDEEVIREHDKLRGTRQKISEPDTPYNFESQSDISDCESADSGSRGGSVVATSPGGDKGRADLEGVIKAVKVRLPTADQLNKERNARWEDEEVMDESGDPRDQHRFKQKRAQHYNEYHMMRQWRQRHSMDEDDPTDGVAAALEMDLAEDRTNGGTDDAAGARGVYQGEGI